MILTKVNSSQGKYFSSKWEFPASVLTHNPGNTEATVYLKSHENEFEIDYRGEVAYDDGNSVSIEGRMECTITVPDYYMEHKVNQ